MAKQNEEVVTENQVEEVVIDETVEETAGPKIPRKVGGLWIPQEEFPVTVYAYLVEEKIVYVTIMKTDIPEVVELLEKGAGKVVEVQGTLTAPSKRSLDLYRDRAMRWVAEANSLVMMRSKLDRILIQNHLKGLQVGDEVLDLTFDQDKLSVESELLLDGLNPMILEVLLQKYKNEIGAGG